MKNWREIWAMHKTSNNTNSYDISRSLLKRLNEDTLTCHQQMEVLRIVFKKLENSWLAISLEHRVVKDELEEK